MTPLEEFQDEIYRAMCQDKLDSKKFLSNTKFDELITAEKINSLSLIDPTFLGRVFNSSRRVIAILLSIRKLDTLPALHNEGLMDADLPVIYESDNDERFFVSSRKGRERIKIRAIFPRLTDSENFLDHQWRFLAPVFGEANLVELSVLCPLPIIYCCKKRWGGSFGDVRKVKVHHKHLVVDLLPTEGMEPCIAIKQLISDNQESFKKEETALYKIQNLRHDHLIHVISSFKKGQDYFFLFPWAEGGDLRQVWEDKSKDLRTADMIKWALEQMKGIASGVRRLHNPYETSDENGRHGDLKPTNILLFLDNPKNPRGTLRITDVGLAKFHTEITSKRVAGTTTTGGSREYAPPEALDESPEAKRSRSYDIWSLGCLFLEFTIWLLGGISEVDEFSRKRRTARSKYSEYFHSVTSKKNGESHFEILPQVKSYIKLVCKDSRCQRNTMFWDLLNLVETHVLRVDEHKRLNAVELDNRLGIILEKAQSDVSYILRGSDAKNGFEPQTFSRDKLIFYLMIRR